MSVDPEQLTLAGWGWHRISELNALPVPVWPANLDQIANLAHTALGEPVDLGEVMESTVPVDSPR